MKILLKNAHLIDPVLDSVKLGYLIVCDDKISKLCYGKVVEDENFFDRVIKFRFDELCNRNLGSEDYIEKI